MHAPQCTPHLAMQHATPRCQMVARRLPESRCLSRLWLTCQECVLLAEIHVRRDRPASRHSPARLQGAGAALIGFLPAVRSDLFSSHSRRMGRAPPYLTEAGCTDACVCASKAAIGRSPGALLEASSNEASGWGRGPPEQLAMQAAPLSMWTRIVLLL